MLVQAEPQLTRDDRVALKRAVDQFNRVGALRTFAKARDRFEAYPARYLGFNVAGERARLEAWREAIEAGTSEHRNPGPIWRFDNRPLAAHPRPDDGAAQEDGRD